MKTYVTAFLTLVVSASALCQIGGSFTPGATTMSHLWFPGAPAQLIVDRADVQKELKMTPEQVGAVNAILKANGKTFMEQVAENWQRIAKVLSPDQRARALQLAFQATGPASALVPALRDSLTLTKAQTAKLADIAHSYLLSEDKDLMEAQNGDAPSSPDQVKAARTLRQQMMTDAINRVLSPAQTSKIKALQGRPFKFSDPAPKPLSTWIRAMGMSG